MKNITIYSTPVCHFCHMAKDYLTSKNIPFNDINVVGNPEKIKEMIDKSGQRGVPVIDIDGKILVGFDQEQLDAALAA